MNALGAESYGLIALYTSLQVAISIFDIGLSPAMSKEAARFKSGKISNSYFTSLLRSTELVYLLIMIFILIIGFLFARFIANQWFITETYSTNQIKNLLIIISLLLGLRLVEEFYRSILRGFDDHIWLNKFTSLISFLRWGGAFFLLLLIDKTLKFFFIIQCAISIFAIILYLSKVYNSLPKTTKITKFNIKSLSQIRKFSAGMSVIGFTSFILNQADKLLLSGYIDLSHYGYYMIAVTITSGVAQLVAPISLSIYPKFVSLISNNETNNIKNIFNISSQLISLCIIPLSIVLMFFSKETLFAWTGNTALTLYSYPILQILLLTNLVNSLASMPYILQISYGVTRLTIINNVIAIIFYLLPMFFIINKYGLFVLLCWSLLINIILTFLSINFTFKRFFYGKIKYWFYKSFLIPIAISTICIFFLRLCYFELGNKIFTILYLFGSVVLTILLNLYFMPNVKKYILHVSK